MSPAATSAELFTAEELSRLQRLRIRRRRSIRGTERGEWRSARTGAGGLFSDHRAYVPGDDPRYVDWNVYGRLGDLVVKRFEAEENLHLLLCVDRSLSMAGAKSRSARRLAGALGYLALAHLDRVRLAWLPGERRRPPNLFRGQGRVPAFFEELAGTPDEGGTDHVGGLRTALAASRTRGLAVLLSDFFDPTGAVRGLAHLRAHGHEVGALHIVDPADADVPEGVSIVAVDRETGEDLVLDVTPALKDRIRQAWVRRAVGLERWCLSREIPYLRVDVRRGLWDALRDLLAARVAVGA
ncbi:MAG: DUF58 domain-containing protein [Planctomycetota bacterium]